MNSHSTIGWWRNVICTGRIAVFVCLAVALSDQAPLMAESVLFDNTDHVWSLPHSGPKNVLWIGTGGGPAAFLEAKPFYLGGHDSISSVSIPVGLEDSTPKCGSFRVTLWDADEDSFPGQEIHQFGVVDIASLPVVGDFDIPASAADNGQELPLVRFDTPVTGLTPGETYFLVSDFDNLPASRDGVILGLSNSFIGANGAGGALATDENGGWKSVTNWFAHGRYIQMKLVSADDPFDVVSSSVGKTYTESFDSMGTDGERGFLPAGWAYYDEIVENDVDDPSDDQPIYNNYLTDAFPPDLRLSGPTIFNAGAPGESDRALALGTHSQSNESTIQFVTEVAGGGAESLQLSFDIEAWDADTSRSNPGEAAFNVALDLDTGDGFQQIIDLGRITTGATLVPTTGDFVNGNDDAFRTSFDSGVLNAALPDGSLLRVRWMADKQANTRGWVFGLDNVSLGMFPEPVSVSGDFTGNGTLTTDDIDLLTAEIAAGEPFDVTTLRT